MMDVPSSPYDRDWFKKRGLVGPIHYGTNQPLGCNPRWSKHLFGLIIAKDKDKFYACKRCGKRTPDESRFCPSCGYAVWPDKEKHAEGFEWFDLILRDMERLITDDSLPREGVYIYFHPYERYKIGKSDRIDRRIDTHMCAAPSLEVLHVIETSDISWCERFLHNKFQSKRIYPDHEYFDLEYDDIYWLFTIDVLNPPKNTDSQLFLLDLLERFPERSTL